MGNSIITYAPGYSKTCLLQKTTATTDGIPRTSNDLVWFNSNRFDSNQIGLLEEEWEMLYTKVYVVAEFKALWA